MRSKRVAIVHDWLCVAGGAEVVLKHLLHLFPDADIYTMADSLKHRDFLEGRKIYTSPLQKYKFIRKKYQYFIPFMPYFVEQFDLREYDLIISSSHFVAKGVITAPEQLHVSYIYSPLRYAWDLYFEYRDIGALGRGLKGLLMRLWLHRMRMWDFVSAYRADFLIADSRFIQKRIESYWRRDSVVIYPPVEIEDAVFSEDKQEYYVTLSRLVEYKRIDLIVEAFNEMPKKKLVIIGDGRDKNKLKKLASQNIEFKGYLPKKEAMQIVSRAKAFVFMSKEDFGIAPIEAQACGTPVIAFGEGGTRETVLDGKTGVLVKHQSVESLKESMVRFDELKFSAFECREFSKKFSDDNFRESFMDFIKKCEEKK